MKLALIPHLWTRHFQAGLFVGGAAVIAWWAVVTVATAWQPWSVGWDGAMYLGALAAATCGASAFGEAWILGRHHWKQWILPPIAALVAGGIVAGWLGVYTQWAVGWMFEDRVAGAHCLVSLRYHLLPWVVTGMTVGVVGASVRRLNGLLVHLGAGLVSGLVGGGVWYAVGYAKFTVGPGDLFYGAALGALAFGFSFAVLAWPLPDHLYVGWVRVLAGGRYGRRVPVDGRDGGARERFVGSWLRGLDIHLPDPGVAELHASVGVDADQRYRGRGLTLLPTAVLRFLERIDLRYDPKRPAPLETPLHSGDRFVLGESKKTAIEFLLLPKDEP